MSKEKEPEFFPPEHALPTDYVDKMKKNEKNEDEKEPEKEDILDMEESFSRFNPSDFESKTKNEEGEETKEKEQTAEDILKNNPELVVELKKDPASKEEKKNETWGQVDAAMKNLKHFSDKIFELDKKRSEQTGLLFTLGIKKKDSSINDEYEAVMNLYNEWLEKAINLTGKTKEQIEAELKGVEINPEQAEKVKAVEKGLDDAEKKNEKEINGLEKEQKGFFNSLKKIYGNKWFKVVVGATILGIAIVTPPVGGMAFWTMGMIPGILPAELASLQLVTMGAAGGTMLKGGLEEMKNKTVKFAESLKSKGSKSLDLTKEPNEQDNEVSKSKIDNISDLEKELKKLNPEIDTKIYYGLKGEKRIYSSKPVEELKLPEGFYYNDKNGLTNKHNTSGAYMSVNISTKKTEVKRTNK